MKWKELEGQYLKGIMDCEDGTLFYLKDRTVLADSHNMNYSWYDNWGLSETEYQERDDRYKAIGEEILSVHHDGDEKETGRIFADTDKWHEAVGDGYWGPKEGANYFFLWVKTKTKTIRFGTVYHDCHYPDTLWELED